MDRLGFFRGRPMGIDQVSTLQYTQKMLRDLLVSFAPRPVLNPMATLPGNELYLNLSK